MAKTTDERLQAYGEYLAKDLLAARLREIEARVKAQAEARAAQREREGYAPVTTDTGQVIGWVPTRVDTTYDPYGGKR